MLCAVLINFCFVEKFDPNIYCVFNCVSMHPSLRDGYKRYAGRNRQCVYYCDGYVSLDIPVANRNGRGWSVSGILTNSGTVPDGGRRSRKGLKGVQKHDFPDVGQMWEEK